MSYITDEANSCLEEVIANVTRHTHVRVIEVKGKTIHYEWAKAMVRSDHWNAQTITKKSLKLGMKRLELEINVVRGAL